MSSFEPPPTETRDFKQLIAPFFGSSVLRNRTLLAVSCSVFAAYVGIGMVGPVRVLFAQSRGASLTIIGAMASSFLISNFLFQYPIGWLADHWGHKRVMVIGLVIQAILSAMYLLIVDPVTFVVLRFLEGIGAAALLPTARAIIIDTIPREKQGEAYGTFAAFFNAGFLLGPAIGGLLATVDARSAFIGAVICRLIAIVIVLTTVKTIGQGSTNGIVTSQVREALSYRALFTLPLIAAYIIVFGDYLYVGFDMSLMPLWLHDHLGASVAVIGLTYLTWSLPNTILSPFGGRIADRHKRSKLIFISGLAQAPLYLIYGLANTVILIVIFFGVHGLAYAFMQPAVDAHVASSSVSTARAQVQGMYSTFGLFGAFVGASGLGPLYDINFRLPLFAIGIVFSLCILIGGTLIHLSEKKKETIVVGRTAVD